MKREPTTRAPLLTQAQVPGSPRRRSAVQAGVAPARLHLHVDRLGVDSGALAGTAAPTLPVALQQALTRQLAGEVPAVNQVTILDRLAEAIAEQLPAALRPRTPL